MAGSGKRSISEKRAHQPHKIRRLPHVSSDRIIVGGNTRLNAGLCHDTKQSHCELPLVASVTSTDRGIASDGVFVVFVCHAAEQGQRKLPLFALLASTGRSIVGNVT